MSGLAVIGYVSKLKQREWILNAGSFLLILAIIINYLIKYLLGRYMIKFLDALPQIFRERYLDTHEKYLKNIAFIHCVQTEYFLIKLFGWDAVKLQYDTFTIQLKPIWKLKYLHWIRGLKYMHNILCKYQ